MYICEKYLIIVHRINIEIKRYNFVVPHDELFSYMI